MNVEEDHRRSDAHSGLTDVCSDDVVDSHVAVSTDVRSGRCILRIPPPQDASENSLIPL